MNTYRIPKLLAVPVLPGIIPPMRILALDIGDRRIGVAISDELGITAHGRPTLKRLTVERDIERIKKLIEEDQVGQIIIGLPLHMDGRESRQSQKISRFADQIREALTVPVVLWDERLTSFAAEEHLREMGLNWRKRRERVDQMAAVFILQSYLDGHS